MENQVMVKVEHVSRQSMEQGDWVQFGDYEFSRVPNVDEYVVLADVSFVVVSVSHFGNADADNHPVALVRVK